MHKYINIEGINVPYKPKGVEYIKENGIFTPVEEIPIHVAHLQAGRYESFISSACTEIVLDMARESSIRFRGVRTRLLGSEEIPPLHCFIDRDGFYRNESEAAEEAQDFDGDAGMYHTVYPHSVWAPDEDDPRHPYHKQWVPQGYHWMYAHSVWRPDPTDFMAKYHKLERSAGWYALWVKMPKTFESLPLKILSTMPEEKFQPLRRPEPVEAPELIKWGLKVLADNDTGLKTWTLNTHELNHARGLSSEWARSFVCHRDQIRYDLIEKDGLKSRSKDAFAHQASELAITSYIAPAGAWYYSAGSITKKSQRWLLGFQETSRGLIIDPIDLASVLWRNQALLPPMMEPSEGEERELKSVKTYDPELVNHLIEDGLLRFHQFPREGDIPGACMVWLSRPGQAFVGLVDTKRGAMGDMNELGFGYIIPPYAVEIKGELKVVHPMQMMANRLMEYNNEIINPVTEEFCGYFPRNPADLLKCPGKRMGLQKAIMEFCSEYGDMVPTHMVGPVPVPTHQSQLISQHTLGVDFGHKPMTAEQKMEFLLKVNELIPICYAAGKGSNPRIRKYGFARENGTPLWANPGAHARRAGNQRAQLLRADVIPEKMVCAVVCMTTKSQVLITPSGIEKQRSSGVFLPQISKVPTEDHTIPVDYMDWSGKTRRVWKGNTRETIEIGKLLDWNGMKFVPRRYKQATTVRGNIPVDLIVPLDELEAKGCQDIWLSQAKVHLIMIDGEPVNCYLIEREMLRSGAASENVTNSTKPMKIGGLDGICVQKELVNINPSNRFKTDRPLGLPVPNLEFAETLQNCLVEFITN